MTRMPLAPLLRSIAEDLARSAAELAGCGPDRSQIDPIVERLYAHHRCLTIAAEHLEPPDWPDPPEPVDPTD